MKKFVLPNNVKLVDTDLTFNHIRKGLNYDVRYSIMKPIIDTHPEKLKVRIKGQEFELTANYSTSGKTVVYSVFLTEEQYELLNGSRFGLSSKFMPYLSISDVGDVKVHGGGNHYQVYESNADVELL